MSARVEQAMNDAIAMAQFAAQRAVVPQTQGSLFASFFGGVEDAGTRGFVSGELSRAPSHGFHTHPPMNEHTLTFQLALMLWDPGLNKQAPPITR